MNWVEVQDFDGNVDYVPESYLNQGVSRLIDNCRRDRNRFARPIGGNYRDRVIARIEYVESGHWSALDANAVY